MWLSGIWEQVVRFSRCLNLTLMTLAAASELALAQPPDTVTCPESIAAIATCYTTKLDTGAYLLAAVPRNWNGNLIVFAHGGPGPIQPSATYGTGSLRRYALEVKLGYAWIASTYRYLGFSVQQSADDTDQARQYFIDRFGRPKRIIIHGASYGGLVGAMLIERYGANYDGAFFNSGMLAGAVAGYQFRADLRAVYQFYCKNLPRATEPQYPISGGLPAEARMTLDELTSRIDECTGVTKSAAARTELQKKNLANILAVSGFRESVLIRHMQYGTFNFRDIANITHGKSPFSNVHSIYRGSEDDEALNRGVIRFEADAAGIAALKADAEPRAALAVPVMAIHSINDPQVSVNPEALYRDLAKATGTANKLVQVYTDENEHTAQSDAEIAAAFDSLMEWIESGTRPSPQSIAAACKNLRVNLRGPCRYHPDFEPKGYAATEAR
jgi:alpha-beta hydrolase superfamily lysophospholipase